MGGFFEESIPIGILATTNRYTDSGSARGVMVIVACGNPSSNLDQAVSISHCWIHIFPKI